MEQIHDMSIVDGHDVLGWFASGAREVAAHRKYLNGINVFPVADGDTGSNLTATLRAMAEQPQPSPSFAQMLQGISQRGLEGARGNSGIIFASYVSGLAQEGSAFDRVGVRDFARIAFGAVKHLYRAVENPQEGTLMSVIRDWATFLHRNCERYLGFTSLMSEAYRVAQLSLERTRTQLEALRRNNVVDSGAAGFVRFLEGVNRVLADGLRAPVTEAADPEEAAPLLAMEEETPALRYCTEALVDISAVPETEYDALADRALEALRPLGDSLIVSARGGRLKAHIHTNAPDAAVEKLEAFGAPLWQKADDMALQTRLRAREAGGVGIVTDSIADLPDATLLEHRVAVVPMGVLLGEATYLDKTTLRLPRLFREMDAPDGYPTSSQPEPARIRSLLEASLMQFDSLVVLSVSGNLSGTFEAFTKAARQLEAEYPGKRITVVDTRLNSGAQGLLVRLAAERAAAGDSHEQLVQAITERIPRTHIYVCLNTLRYAVRGGRVPDTVGKLGMRLGMRPIMTLDRQGHGAAFGVAFSQAGLTRKIMRLMRRAMRRGGVEAYAIVHGDNPALANEYKEQLTRITGQPPAFISEVSAAVALHAGPGTVAVCLIERG